MKTFILALAAALALGACQSAPSKPGLPASTPPEENAAPPAATTHGK